MHPDSLRHPTDFMRPNFFSFIHEPPELRGRQAQNKKNIQMQRMNSVAVFPVVPGRHGHHPPRPAMELSKVRTLADSTAMEFATPTPKVYSKKNRWDFYMRGRFKLVRTCQLSFSMPSISPTLGRPSPSRSRSCPPSLLYSTSYLEFPCHIPHVSVGHLAAALLRTHDTDVTLILSSCKSGRTRRRPPHVGRVTYKNLIQICFHQFPEFWRRS